LLSGDVGVGKSAFAHFMLKSLSHRTISAKITDPALDAIDFLDILAAEFKIKQRFVSHGDFLMYFNKSLHIAKSKNVRVLLVIEEAQLVSSDMFQLLKDLAAIKAHGQTLMNIFFVGQSKNGRSLKMILENTLKQVIAIHYHLEPLTESETQKLVRHRLRAAGGKQELITGRAMKSIYDFSGGFPRLINLICDRALLTGYSDNLEKIHSGMIQETAGSFGLVMKVK
jgi:general secretion pathway protein A